MEPSFIQRQASHPCARLHKGSSKIKALVEEGLSHSGQWRNFSSTVRDTARWCRGRAIPLGLPVVTPRLSRYGAPRVAKGGTVSESTAQDVRARVIRRILVLTVGAEAVLVGGYGVAVGVGAGADGSSASLGGTVVLVLTFVLLAVFLAVAARAAARARRGARAPIVAWQIIQGLVGGRDALPMGSVWIGVGLLVLAIVAAVGAFWPGVLRDEPSQN
jgi:hypothetical protein